MSEPSRTVRRVDWKAVFPFLHLVRAFRVAIHPTKLLLALALILLVYGVGRSLDAIWHRDYCYPAVTHVEMMTERFVLPDRAGVSQTEDRSGPFDVFLKYELSRLHLVSVAVLSGDVWGIVYRVFEFAFTGPGWGFRNHPLFSSIFGAVLLVGWSLFGGAIARVAAVHVARDEKISVRNALRFSSGKLLSFLFAPVLLGAFIGFLGLVIAVTNLAFYVTFAGPLVVGVVFILTLAVGFVMTLALFGGVGGFGLMYPSVAVEGSDSFDAISRSFSYFFARPWKLAVYSLLGLVYGVVTYLFLKAFVYVMLVLIQTFQIWFLTSGATGMEAKFQLFFPPPQFWSLSYEIDYKVVGEALGVGGKIGAGLVAFWYYLLVGLLGAYAISFYFSASTIVYYILREDVDATELDDVYLEESDEDEIADSADPGGDPASPGGGRPATPASGSADGNLTTTSGSEDSNPQPG